eukprot:g8795.t1
MNAHFWPTLAVIIALFHAAEIFAARPGSPKGCKPLYGVSYDPFSTSGEDICLPTEQVVIDVEIMATVTKSIRIYSIAVCPDATKTVLEESRKHNVTVLMGILINSDWKTIRAELSLLPQLMANYSDVVQAVSVGNQALAGPKIGTRSHYASTLTNLDLLTSYITRVRAILRRRGYKHPVTTAETWAVWESSNGYPLSQSIDFICLNMNPYYEGFEVECLLSSGGRCSTASKYVTSKAEGLSDYFGLDVWVCETSWPTEGNSCCTGLLPYQQSGNKAKASASRATIYLRDFTGRAGGTPYYISSAFDKDWRRVWNPCRSCAEKNLAPSSFKSGVCDLCEEEYQVGLFDQYRERKESFELPTVQCKLPSLPDIRLAGEEPEGDDDEGPTEESSVELSGSKRRTRRGGTKTVMRSSATTTRKEPIRETKRDSETTGEKEKSSTAKTKATTNVSEGSASAKATSVVSVTTSKSTTTVSRRRRRRKARRARKED